MRFKSYLSLQLSQATLQDNYDDLLIFNIFLVDRIIFSKDFAVYSTLDF